MSCTEPSRPPLGAVFQTALLRCRLRCVGPNRSSYVKQLAGLYPPQNPASSIKYQFSIAETDDTPRAVLPWQSRYSAMNTATAGRFRLPKTTATTSPLVAANLFAVLPLVTIAAPRRSPLLGGESRGGCPSGHPNRELRNTAPQRKPSSPSCHSELVEESLLRVRTGEAQARLRRVVT